jgi:hypothetical protein
MPTEVSLPELSELQALLDALSAGQRDPEVARRSRERIDREREELRKRIGTVDVAVDLIREARNS